MAKAIKNSRDTFQVPLLSLLPDETVLDPSIVIPADPRWDDCLDVWAASAYFGFDIETYGLDHPDDGLDPWKGEIRLIQIALRNGLTIVVDLGGREGCPPDPAERIEHFLFLLKRKLQCKKTQVVGHNLKFDCLWMRVKYGIKSRCLRDTLILSRVMWAGVRRYKHSLKAVAERLELGEVDKTEQKSDFSWKLTNSQLNYAANDAQLAILVWMKLGEMLQGEAMGGVALAECSALPAWIQIEYHGMPVDWELLQSTLKAYRSIEADVLSPWNEVFPKVNPASPLQVKPAVETKFKIDINGSDQAALANHWDIPAIRSLSVWRSLRTYIAYLESLEAHYRDGSVRSSYNPLGPMGTRSNSSEPNLQNPPRHNSLPGELKKYNLPPVRGVFKAPEGHKLLLADLSQAHARLATVISCDRTLIDSYNSGADTHCITASSLAKVQKLGDAWTAEAIGKWRKDKEHENCQRAGELRQVAKPTFYGSLNASGGATLKRTAKTDAGIEMSLDEAKEAIKAWRQAYSGLYKFQMQQLDKANAVNHRFGNQDFGEIRGLSGRRIFLPKWPSDFHDGKLSVKLSDSCACTWAGDEKTVMSLAMGEEGFLGVVDEHPEWGAVLVNNCHDELDALVPEEYALEAAAALQNKMQAAMELFIQGVIPVDELGAKPEDLLADSWADK